LKTKFTYYSYIIFKLYIILFEILTNFYTVEDGDDWGTRLVSSQTLIKKNSRSELAHARMPENYNFVWKYFQ